MRRLQGIRLKPVAIFTTQEEKRARLRDAGRRKLDLFKRESVQMPSHC